MMHQPAREPRPHKFESTLLLAFLLPVFAWAPLTYPGYFVFRSGFLPIFNLVDRMAYLPDLAWMPALGTGYRLLGGDGWLSYSLAALPAALSASPSGAIKWVFAASFVAGSAGAYAWTRHRHDAGWPAVVAAAVYVFSPIWLTAVYTHGAFATAVLLGLLPWVLWAVDAAIAGARAGSPILALLAAACLWTHPALGLAYLVMVLVYLLVMRVAEKRSLRELMGAAIGWAGGLVLGALGLLPAILRRGAGTVELPEAWQWLVLLAPWLALLGGWIAQRLAGMLPEHTEGEYAPLVDRAPLFASLVALALLGAYANARPVAWTGPVPTAPLAIFGENEIVLLSVEPEGTPGPGRAVAVDVEWQALKPLARDYTVFFHVVAGAGQRYGQQDTMPQAGKLPTTQWEPGQVVMDRYEAVLSPDASIDSDYQYWLGWYLSETQQRLSVGQDDKFVIRP